MNDLTLTDEQLETVVYNVANTKDGLKLFGHLIERSGLNNPGFIGNDRDIYNKGWSDFGLEIRDLMMSYAFDRYVDLLKEGVKKDDN